MQPGTAPAPKPGTRGKPSRRGGVVPNSVEHVLLGLVVVEVGILWFIRRAFSSAQGG